MPRDKDEHNFFIGKFQFFLRSGRSGGARLCPPPPTFRVGIAPACELKQSCRGSFSRAVSLCSTKGADLRPLPLSVRQSRNHGQSKRYPVFGFFFTRRKSTKCLQHSASQSETSRMTHYIYCLSRFVQLHTRCELLLLLL